MNLNENSPIENNDSNSIDNSQMDDNAISGCRNSLEISPKISDDLENFSSRINMLNDQYSNRTMSKNSLILLAKHYPNYQHYTHRVALFNRYRKIPESHTILPEIKGHTLNNIDREDQNAKQIHDNISMQINTLKDLTNSILRYGGKSDGICMKFPSARNGQKLVRPGFSARRYMAHLVGHLNDNLVEKLIADGKILEKTIFQSSLILPHIRRRLSADLSRYPEPYRILKQMLMSPGPLNEFSFIWTKKKKSEYLSHDESCDQETEMDIGDIKILSKKKLENNNEVFEEIPYANMSRDKKKTVLSNLLLKSAMNHALKIKEEIIEHNSETTDKTTKDNVHNIHIPIINFDMREAVTDLLNKETFQMLSSNSLSTSGQTGFKGQALKPGGPRENKNSEFPENFTLENNTNFPMISIDQAVSCDSDKSMSTINLLPNLTLRLNSTNVHKSTNYLKKKATLETHSEVQSSSSASHHAVIAFDPSNFGLPDFQAQQEAQSIAFVERLKNKPMKSGTLRDKIHPYGKYRGTEDVLLDSNSIPIGDIDPTSSFNNWKYDDSKNTNSEYGKGFDSSSLSSSGNFANSSLFNAKLIRKVSKGTHPESDIKLDENQNYDFNLQNNQNRLIQLLSEHAETVAERVLSKSGGEDFASDVNEAVMQWNEILKEKYFELFSYIAILEILKQRNSLVNHAKQTNGQIWNLDVQDLKNEEEYTGMIKNIFKSLFKEKLDGIPIDDVEISPSVMALLQNGSNLAIDAIEVFKDPITGKPIVRLKQTIQMQPESFSRNSLNFISRASNHSQLNNLNRSDTESELKMIKPVISSISPIIIDSVWDGRSFSKDIHSNSFVIVEENIDVEETTQSANQQRVLNIVSQSSDVQNDHSVLSHNQTPSSNDAQTNISQSKQNNIGFNNLTASSQDKPINKSFINTKSSTENDAILSSSSQTGIHKSFSKQSKQEFVVGRVDKTKDTISLYSPIPSKTEKPKLQKVSSQSKLAKNSQKNQSNKKMKQDLQKPKKKAGKSLLNDSETLPLTIKPEVINNSDILQPSDNSRLLIEKEDSGDINLHHESTNHTLKSSQDVLSEFSESNQRDQLNDEAISDEENDYNNDGDDGDEENREKRILMRQQREAKRKADADRRRLEVERKRREKEEQRKSENKRRELEEIMSKRLEEERRLMEDEFRLKQEREKLEELEKLDALKQQEYLRLKQIEKERKEKEEFNRRLEEMKIQQAIEDERRKLEQERLAFEESERIRIENEMISRMRDSERIQYLKKKAEEEECKRLREEEERRVKEENARMALEEAQRIAQQQAKERAILEARLKFSKGVKIENEGLKKFLNVTPNFIWSYFEFLKILGLQPNPSTDKIEIDNKLTD